MNNTILQPHTPFSVILRELLKSGRIVSSFDIILRELNESSERVEALFYQIHLARNRYFSHIITLIDPNNIKFPDENIDSLNDAINDFESAIGAPIPFSEIEQQIYERNIKKADLLFQSIEEFNASVFVFLRKWGTIIDNSPLSIFDPTTPGFSNNRVGFLVKYFELLNEEYLSSLIARHYLKIFNGFALSILKGEYLFDSELSLNKINLLRDKILKKQEIENKKPVSERFALYDCISFDEYLGSILRINTYYFNFNRKIDKLIDNENSININFLVVEDFAVDALEFKRWNDSYNVTSFHPFNILGLYKLFPYVFGLLLDMTYIDHNFAVGEDELRKLLLFRETLLRLKDIMTKWIEYLNLSSSQTDIQSTQCKNVLADTISEFIITLTLVSTKNNYLISKIIDQDKTNTISNYSFIYDDKVISFNSYKESWSSLKDDVIDKDKLLKSICFTEDNDLIHEWESAKSYRTKMITKVESDSFTEYEKQFLCIISSKTNDLNYEHLIKNFSSFLNPQLFYKSKLKDVWMYDNKHKIIFSNHFLRYSKCVKQVSSIKDYKNECCDEYMEEVLESISSKPEKELYSCSFITKHLEFSLQQFDYAIKNKKTDLINKYIKYTDLFLGKFGKLLRAINKGCYCINFSSLFKDSYYCVNINSESKVVESIKRIKIDTNEDLSTQIFSSDNNMNAIFIASTWNSPIGKIYLERKYEELFEKQYDLNMKAKELLTELHTKDIDDSIRRELEVNNRNTIQILGVLAAFLALATIFADGLANFNTPIQFLQVIGGITMSMTFFVFLLHYIGSIKMKNSVVLQVVIPILLILGILLIVFLIPLSTLLGIKLTT